MAVRHKYLEKDDLTLHTLRVKGNDDLQTDKNELPFPLGVVSSGFGLKLINLESIDWITQADGQITDLSFYFTPTSK